MQNDLISRSELIKRIKTFTNISDSYYQNADILLAEIYNMPTAYSVEKVVDRLTERERNFDNTGIAMESLTSDGRANLSDFVDKVLTKLADYEDAEEQGLLLRLPCKVGDTFWELNDNFLEPAIYPRKAHSLQHVLYCMDRLGTVTFLTKEEAEQKLESMKGE